MVDIISTLATGIIIVIICNIFIKIMTLDDGRDIPVYGD